MTHFLSCLDYPNEDRQVVNSPDPLVEGHSQHLIGRSRHILGPSLNEW